MLPDTVASSHIWLLSTLNGDTVTRELNFEGHLKSDFNLNGTYICHYSPTEFSVMENRYGSSKDLTKRKQGWK